MPEERLIGKVTHYFPKISVAVIELDATLSVGEQIHIKGHTTDLSQEVDSMQIEHKDVKVAPAGSAIGLKVKERVREGDLVYKVLG